VLIWHSVTPMPPPPDQRIPGRMRSQGPLSNPNVSLLEPMQGDELAGWEARNLLPKVPQPWANPWATCSTATR
jgi:hypothetical protein